MTRAARDLHEALDVLESTLAGTVRRDIVDRLCAARTPSAALHRLRSALRTHTLVSDSGTLALDPLVRRLDQRTRREGFRVLHSWDHTAHRFTEDITPVLMLDYFERDADDGPDAATESGEGRARVAIEILLDYYLMHLLALGAMRAWDAEDPDAVLDRVSGLVEALQGADGSGHRFVEDAETLIIYALSQFHPEEHAYDRLIAKVATLRAERRTRFARWSASVLSCHLRWGFWLMYDRDVLRMRRDNVGDYPWLLSSVATLMQAYVRLREAEVEGPARDEVVDALLQGFAADPWAFGGSPPPALEGYAGAYGTLRSLLERHGTDLLDELEAHRPAKDAYAPLSLHFNFPHNTLVALVALALRSGEPQRIPLNALFRRGWRDEPAGASAAAGEGAPAADEGAAAAEGAGDVPDASAAPSERVALARALQAYSGESPDRLGAHGALLVAYDPLSGLRSFAMTVDAIRESIQGR